MPERKPGTAQRISRAIGLRVAVFGAAGLVALLLAGELSDLRPRRIRGTAASDPPDGVVPERPGWPHRRGPNYDGISAETDLADSWPDDGPPVLWSREVGRGYSAITAAGNRVYTQAQSLSRQAVLCFDADTGQPVWSHRYAWPYDPAGMYPGPRSTPTWHEGRIYFAGPCGLVGCLDAATGRPVWSINVIERFGGRGHDFGYACSPTVEDGKVFMPVGGKGASLVALDAGTGATVWASGDEPASYCSVIPITLGGRRLVVAFMRNALMIFDPATGRLCWHDKFSHDYDEHAAAPMFEEPYLVVASAFRRGAECYRLELEPGDPPIVQGRSAWFNPKFSNDVASSVLYEGHIYGFDLRDIQAKAHRPSRGEFRCLDVATGEVRWSSDEPGHASLIVADGKLILLNDRGELILARASPKQYTELARAKVFGNEICWTAPALSDGRLYLRSPTRAVCLYLGVPERLDEQRLAAARTVAEIAATEGFDWTGLVGGEREYAFDPADLRELTMWYLYSLLGVLGLAAAASTLAYLCPPASRTDAARRRSRVVFWCLAFLLGVAGTPVFNRLASRFVFTWPVALCVAHQLALWATVRSSRQRKLGQSTWWTRTAVLFFLAVCLAYFLVCRRLSLAIEWIFLLGFMPSWPIAIPAAYQLDRPRPPWHDMLWAVLSFTAFFWSSAAIVLWRMAAG
ncbi:MAG: PQQ-binding-like beta-propeller repeat protein [Thermoguttaceae bacterium]|jgi:outer membrane protein assembly factor BamB|nr:PQQ-binding-like beta-propeller repeat protein [Thermoguttaceae bacterium]